MSRLVKAAHYVVLAVVVGGGVAYWMLKPPSLNPMADRRSADAMALVQTHRARHAPTVRQAIEAHVQKLQEEGKGVRPGEWRVERERDEVYLVRIIMREAGSRTWFEREYLWRVSLPTQTVEPITMAAEDVMPLKDSPDLDGPMGRPPVPSGR